MIVPSGSFCCELVAGNPAALQRVLLRVSLRAFPACCDPVVSLFVYCLLEEACRYRKYFEAFQEVIRKSDSSEDCRWTVALGTPQECAQQIWFRSFTGGQQVKVFAGQKKEFEDV